jgi:hypothetical protein
MSEREMKIGFNFENKVSINILKELLSPWDFNYANKTGAEVIFTNKNLLENKTITIIIPDTIRSISDKKNGKNFKVNELTRKKILLDNLSFQLSPIKNQKDNKKKNEHIIYELENSTFLLRINVIKEYITILKKILYPEISRIYNYITDFPIPYKIVPSKLREILLGTRKTRMSNSYYNHLCMDALRYLLLEVIKKTKNETLPKKNYNGCKYACLITHDVETRQGLKKSIVLKKIE